MPLPAWGQTADALRADLAAKEAALLYTQARYAEAEPLYKRSLRIREEALGPDHPLVAQSLNDLGVLYRTQGRYPEAEPLYQRSLAIRERALGASHPDTATSLNNLGRLFHDQGRFADAEALYLRGLAIRESALGPMHPEVAFSLHNIGTLYWERGRFAEAEPVYKRSLAIREKSLPPDDAELARSLNNLALLYWNQGRYAEAEPMYQKSLAIREKTLGPGHPDVAISLNNLALLFYSQGRYAEAETFYKRCAAIAEKALGPNHTMLAQALANLARTYADQGRYAEAEPLYQRSLVIRERALGPEHPDLAVNLNALGLLYEGQSRYVDAEPPFRRALAIREHAFGAEHHYVGQSRNNLARLYHSSGRYAEAEPLYLSGLAIREKLLGPAHPDVAISLDNLARLYAAEDRPDFALGYSRRAFELLRARFSQGTDQSAGQLAEQRNKRSYFVAHIGLLGRLRQPAAVPESNESFEAAQLAQASSVGQSVAQMATRFAAHGGALADAIRQRQDTADRLARADKALIAALGQPSGRIDAANAAALREAVAALQESLGEETRAMVARFPQYDALVSAAPISGPAAQQLVHADEALLLYLVDDSGCFAWVVRRDRVELHRLEITAKDLASQVSQLRSRLDPEQNSSLAPFDAAASKALYAKVFAPLERSLEGATHLILVPDGPLQSLPFAVLVDSVAGGKPSWLIDRYAFSVVPSVSALRALRTFTRSASGTEPFVGYGNPVLQGPAANQRRLTTRAIFRTRASGAAGVAGSGLADVAAIRQASPLPETADELEAVARTLGASADSLHLQSRASETSVKRADLSRYRILAFATHGVMAGELSGVAEPGLILTPPAQATELDDGYLSASEVAQLKLNADWVVLSACNTAAPDGTPGAEGLSGLAKGFFYAGARSLLVSNWYVESKATVRITTEMFQRYASDPGIGKARALRQAMLRLKSDPRYEHPLFWAPFVVVGEGGA